MNKLPKGKWDGLAALILMAAIMALDWPTSFSRWVWSHLPESVGFAFWCVCGPLALVLIISGLWRGNTVSRICSILALCLVAVIVLMICMAGV
jgi:hypothetical protein